VEVLQLDSSDLGTRAPTAIDGFVLQAASIDDRHLAWIRRSRRSNPTAAGLLLSEEGREVQRALLWSGLDRSITSLEPALVTSLIRKETQKRRACSVAEFGASEKSVLVVDPDEQVRASYADALEPAGYLVLRYANGFDALRAVREHRPQILLAEHKLADLSGTDVVAAARRYCPLLTSLIVTDDPTLEVPLIAMRGGACHVLIKPLRPREIVEAVARAWTRWALSPDDYHLRPMGSDAPLSVLHVEDDPAHAIWIRSLLQNAAPEWRIHWVKSLAEAVEACDSDRFDAIVTDLNLPDSRGVRTVAQLRTQARSSAIVAVGGEIDSLMAENLILCGAQEYLRKADVTGDRLRTRVSYTAHRQSLMTSLDQLVLDLHASRSSLALANARLEQLATVDPLTDLNNRRGFESALIAELDRAKRNGSSVCSCLIDCDRFKQINDRFGHATGDIVLREVAGRMRGALRTSDTIGRIEGDEFLILMPDTRPAEAMLVAECVRIAVSTNPVMTSPEPVRVTVSAGVSSVPRQTASIEELLIRNRDALARSKELGRNRASRADLAGAEPDYGPSIDKLLMGQKGLRTMAQPIVDLTTAETLGFELLSRGPRGPNEQPVHFLQRARAENVLTTVDLHCLRSSLEAINRLNPDASIHVNLFPTTLLDLPIGALEGIFSPHVGRVCVELSEEQFIGHPKELIEKVSALKAMGVKLAIDDVGKGRGTFDSVMLLEPAVVKVDRELVNGLTSDVSMRRLLRRLLLLATSLGCELIAEGVETSDDAQTLLDLGVKQAQGYLWAQPMEMVEALDWPVRTGQYEDDLARSSST